jgi:1-acyl-sn-glycerol-3-phosphate acyltransferase
MAPAQPATGPLNRAWRIFATGLSFSVFGLVGLVAGITVFPAACLTAGSRDAARRRAQLIVHRWFGLFADLMRGLGLLTYEVRGVEHLATPGALIVANHPSLIDVVLLLAHVREADCIVKPAVFANPFMRWPVTWAGYICHRTPEQLIEDCARVLRQGHALLVFPEGTRTVPGQPIRMSHGAARIALEAGARIVPVTIACTETHLFKGLPWYRVPPRKPRYVLTVGEPYAAATFLAGAGGSASVATRHLTHHWEQYFAARTGAAAAHPLAPAATRPQYSSSNAAPRNAPPDPA